MVVTIGEQTFRIRVTPAEQERYARIAAHANDVLEGLRRNGTLGGARALAMALFQVAAELDDARARLTATSADRERLSRLIERIDQATDRAAEAPPPAADTEALPPARPDAADAPAAQAPQAEPDGPRAHGDQNPMH